jgi:hypothetical protein
LSMDELARIEMEEGLYDKVPVGTAEPAESDASIMARLVFDWDGTISTDQLEGIPGELIQRITSPGFVAMAKAQIAKARGIQKTGRREMKRPPVMLYTNKGGPNRKQRRILAAGLK